MDRWTSNITDMYSYEFIEQRDSRIDLNLRLLNDRRNIEQTEQREQTENQRNTDSNNDYYSINIINIQNINIQNTNHIVFTLEGIPPF